MKTVIFDANTIGTKSKPFYAVGLVRVVARNLPPGSRVQFTSIELAEGTRSTYSCCQLLPSVPGHVVAESLLQCPTCESDQIRPVKITDRNPVIYLNSPVGNLIQAEYVDAAGTATQIPINLFVYIEEVSSSVDSSTLSQGDLGCPPRCCQDDPPVWVDTGDTKEVLDTPTAPRDSLVALPTGTLKKEQVNQCGDYQWVDVSPIQWVNTNEERCLSGFIEYLYRSDGGLFAWLKTTSPCGYEATYKLPCGGYAYRPSDIRHPDATVLMSACPDANGGEQQLFYLHPAPIAGATIPVTECTTDTVLGYAANTGIDASDTDCGDDCTKAPVSGTVSNKTVVDTITTSLGVVAVWSDGTTSTVSVGYNATWAVATLAANMPQDTWLAGFGYGQGDAKDPAATVNIGAYNLVNNGSSIYVYPTPRNFATTPVHDPSGNIIGWAVNNTINGQTVIVDKFVSYTIIPS